MTDYYKELELDKSHSADQLGKDLIKLRKQWMQRQNSPKQEVQQKAKVMVDMIDEAMDAFENDEAKAAYDKKLAASSASSSSSSSSSASSGSASRSSSSSGSASRSSSSSGSSSRSSSSGSSSSRAPSYSYDDDEELTFNLEPDGNGNYTVSGSSKPNNNYSSSSSSSSSGRSSGSSSSSGSKGTSSGSSTSSSGSSSGSSGGKKKKSGCLVWVILIVLVVVGFVKRDSLLPKVQELRDKIMGHFGASTEESADTSDNAITLTPADLEGISEFNGHYYAIYDDAESWGDAKRKCELMGGHLLTISSMEEDSFAMQLMSSAGCDTAFFGLYNSSYNSYAVWTWVTGETVEYTRWAAGMPDNYDNNEIWAGYYEGAWVDCEAYDTNVYICEWDSAELQPVSLVDTMEFNGHTYQFRTDVENWEQANITAQGEGGYLAAITSAEENAFLLAQLHSRGLTNACFGLTDPNLDGGFYWTDGEAVSFTDWAEEQPDYQSEEYYVGFWDNGQWNDYPNDPGDCDVYIFEWDTTGAVTADTMEYDGHAYAICNTLGTWQKDCLAAEAAGGYLACITSAEEDAFLTGQLSQREVEHAFFGLIDTEHNGKFKWINGEKLSYKNWDDGAPNNVDETEYYGCYYGNYHWDDASNDIGDVYTYIIEWDSTDPGNAGSAAAAEAGNASSVAADAVGFNGHAYAVRTTGGTWTDDNEMAQAEGGYLACVSSAEENAFLTDLLQQKGVTNAFFGMYDPDQSGTYQWVDGEEVTYTNWNEGEPNCYGGAEFYAGITEGGVWNDWSNDNADVFCYIIEWNSTDGTNLLYNGNADDGVNGWTAAGDTWYADQYYGEDYLYSGNFFYPWKTAGSELYQDVDISSYADDTQFSLTGYARDYSGADSYTLRLSFLGSDGSVLSTDEVSGNTAAWNVYSVKLTKPSGAVTARVSLVGTRYEGEACDAFFDEISLTAAE